MFSKSSRAAFRLAGNKSKQSANVRLYSKEASKATEPKGGKPTEAAPAGPAAPPPSGGGGAGRALLGAAVLAPPLYVLYMTRNNPAFRETFKEQFPAGYDLVTSVVTPVEEPTSIDGKSTVAIKAELDDLEARWAKFGSHLERFSRAEVEAIQSKMEDAKKMMAESTPPPSSSDKAEMEESTKDQPKVEEPREEVSAAALANEKEVEPIVPPAREKLDALREKARGVKSKADQDTDSKIKNMEKELRADLEVVLSHDLRDLDEDGLRQRIVQLVLELKDRNRWEALRMYELTKKHTEDLVQKYDDLLREQQDRYEELIRFEVAKSASKSAEETQHQAEEHFARVMRSKEDLWHRTTQDALERQRQDLGKELEQRFQQAKAAIENKAGEEMHARLQALTNLKEKARRLEEELSSHSQAQKSSKQLQAMSVAMVDLQHALYKTPEELGAKVSQLEKASGGDKVVSSTLRSLSSRVRTGAVPTELELIHRFDSVYENCYRVALVPDDGGVLEHAVAHVVAGLTIRGGKKSTEESNDQQAALSRARFKLLEENNLEAAVKEMDGLKGLVKDTASDWLTEAKDRLAVEQAILLLKSHIASLSSSVSK